MSAHMSMNAVNGLGEKAFIKTFGNVVEMCSLCAAAVYCQKPFASLDDLYHQFCAFIDALPAIGKEGILRSHPDLADRMETLTLESQREHSKAGIASLGQEDVELLRDYNQRKRHKFGFPFVICARLNNKETILSGAQTRLNNEKSEELETGIVEVKKIMLLRLKDLVDSGKSKL